MALRLVLSLAAAWFGPTPAAAQVQQDSREEARVEFQRASQAADEGRWADALQGFERAYLLSGVPNALFNAGMALRALGRHRESRDAFDRLIEAHGADTDLEEARRMRTEEAARVAIIELQGLDPDASYDMRLDGREVPSPDGERVEIEADPGTHTVTAERSGYEPFNWEGSLRDGQREVVQVAMVELPEPRSAAKSPILWTVLGLVLAGGAVATVILVDRAQDLEPESDNVLTVKF